MFNLLLISSDFTENQVELEETDHLKLIKAVQLHPHTASQKTCDVRPRKKEANARLMWDNSLHD